MPWINGEWIVDDRERLIMRIASDFNRDHVSFFGFGMSIVESLERAEKIVDKYYSGKREA